MTSEMRSWILFAFALCGVVAIPVLDALGIDLKDESMAYVRLVIDLGLGGGLALGLKGAMDAKATKSATE